MKALRSGMLWLLGAAAACASGAGPTATPAQIVASAGDNQIGAADAPLPLALQVTVRDGAGNPLAGIPVNWIVSGGGSVAPARSTTGTNGTATTIRTLGTNAGPQGTTAQVPGSVQIGFTHIAQIQGATEIAASGSAARSDSVTSTAPFAAVVHDQNGTPVAGVIVTWSATGGGVLSRRQDTTDAAGLTTVTLTLSPSAGRQTAQASVTGLIGSPLSFMDDAVAGHPVRIAVHAGDFQVGAVTTSLRLPHSVLVSDAHGNPTPSVIVQWAVGDGGGLVNGAGVASTITNALGLASVSRTMGPAAGAYSDTATAVGLPGSPVIFSDTAGALFTIQVGNDFFRPQIDTVPTGSFLRFVWVSGGNLHNITWDPGDPTPPLPDSPNESALNASFLVRVTGIGSYGYHCAFHGGAGTGVFGVIVTE